MKRKIKWISIAIVMLIIVALVLILIIHNYSDNDNNNENSIALEENVIPYNGPTNIIEIEDAKGNNNLMIIPRNFSEAIKSYKGPVSTNEIKRKFYKLIAKDIPYISENTKLLNDTQIAEYYENNFQEINDMNIYSKDEFINICNEIKQNKTDEIPSSSIELSTCENTVENYSFELILDYSENKIIRLKVILSNTENKIEFEKYDELKKVYLSYTGPITKQEIRRHLNFVAINAKNVYNSCKDLNLNEILQYYDLNKSTINTLGIYSNKDYLDVTNQIVRITFRNNPTYIGFIVKPESIKSNEKYTSFEANLNYTTDESLKLIVNLINSIELVNEENPKLKITAEIKEESE